MVFVLSTSGCFKPPSYTIEKTIPLPDSLSGLSYDAIAYSRRDNRVLVGLDDGRVLVIDATTGEKLAIVPSNGPGVPVYDPVTDEVYLSPAEPRGHTDARRDSLLSTLAEVRMYSPEEMCVDPVTDRIYCYLHTWSDSITVLDSRTLRVVASAATAHHVPFGTNAICCSPQMHRVYWVQADGHSPLIVVDAGTNQTIAFVEVGQNATPLLYNPRANKVYIRSDSPALLVLDCRSNRVVASIPVTGLSDQMCCNVREDKVYGIQRDSVVVVIDGASDQIVDRIRLPGEAYDFVYDSTRNRVYCCGQDWVAAVDGRTDKVVRLVRTGTTSYQTRGVFCPQANMLYFLQSDPCEVYAIDCAEFTIAKRTTVGYYVEAVVYSSGQDKVYCANASGDAVVAIDASAESIRSIAQVERYPWALCTNKDGTRVYCANMGSSTVSVIDGRTGAVIDSIGVAKCPVGLCYNTRRDKLYCSSESLISVIDCRADTILEKIDVRTDLWPSMLYDSVCDRIFCISDDRVVAIDAVRDSIVAETQAKTSLRGLVYDPVHEKMYCSAWDGRDIYIVDCRSMKIRCKAVTGVAAWLARVLPCPHVAYVKYGRGIAIINTDNDCVVGMVELAKTANGSWLPQPNQFAYASRHDRLFVASQRSSVDVFREDAGR